MNRSDPTRCSEQLLDDSKQGYCETFDTTNSPGKDAAREFTHWFVDNQANHGWFGTAIPAEHGHHLLAAMCPHVQTVKESLPILRVPSNTTGKTARPSADGQAGPQACSRRYLRPFRRGNLDWQWRRRDPRVRRQTGLTGSTTDESSSDSPVLVLPYTGEQSLALPRSYSPTYKS